MATKRAKRPEMRTREELELYLKRNPDTELPFIEELWERCVELCELNQDKKQQSIVSVVTDSNGNTTEKKQYISNVIKNPVQQYFKMCGLTQYKKLGLMLKDEIEANEIKSDSQRELVNLQFGTDNLDYNDEIISWINIFKPIEKDFLIKRYSSYFDQYEINEGADKTSLKRILSLEIALYRIDIKRAEGKPVDINDEKKMSELLQSTFESLKWTKKQRNARDDLAQNKFTVWMEKQTQEGGFKPEKKTYDKDEIDFLIDTIIESTKEMLS